MSVIVEQLQYIPDCQLLLHHLPKQNANHTQEYVWQRSLKSKRDLTR